jgi:hypothetical protein
MCVNFLTLEIIISNVQMFHLKDRIVKPEEAPIAKQQPGKHAPAATDMHPRIEEPREAVFPMRSIPRLYNEDHRQVSQQLVVTQQSKLWLAVNTKAKESPQLGATTKQ